jgi:hypothetical protein
MDFAGTSVSAPRVARICYILQQLIDTVAVVAGIMQGFLDAGDYDRISPVSPENRCPFRLA